jgi:hypothetical protein
MIHVHNPELSTSDITLISKILRTQSFHLEGCGKLYNDNFKRDNKLQWGKNAQLVLFGEH